VTCALGIYELEGFSANRRNTHQALGGISRENEIDH
jgi:hypothetical protein